MGTVAQTYRAGGSRDFLHKNHMVHVGALTATIFGIDRDPQGAQFSQFFPKGLLLREVESFCELNRVVARVKFLQIPTHFMNLLEAL